MSAQYQFFATEKSVSKSDFLTALHTIFLFKTQGSPSTARRTLTERELSCIVKHFFGDADTIDSGVDFENFLKWFEATTDVLREEPYNELFVKGFIFAPLDSETVGTLLGGSSTNNPGTFFLMCSLKEQGKVGIVLKNAGLKIVRRPLVCCSKTAAGVAASLNMYEELSTITKVSGSKVEAFDKEVGLNELISRDDEEEEEEEGEFTGVPFVI